jgi:uncharacterized membrane protein YbhN (UPF0104 family)
LALPYTVATGLYAWPWALLLPPGIRPPWGAVVRGRFVSAAINVVLPTGLLGEPARLRSIPPAGWGLAGEALVWDRALYQAACATFLFAMALVAERAGLRAVGVAAVLAAVVALVWALGMLGTTRVPWVRRLAARALDHTTAGEPGLRLRPPLSVLAVGFLLHVAGRVVVALEVWLGAAVLGQSLGLEAGVLASGAIVLTSMALPIVPGQLGVQEVALAAAMIAAGHTPETGVAIAILIRIRQLVFVPLGLLLALRGGLDGRQSTAATGD